MKNLREQIKALLLLGDSPRFAITELADRVRPSLTVPRHLSIFAAILEDALDLVDDVADKAAARKASKAKA